MSQLEEIFAFHLRAAGLPDSEREYVFAPPRKWRFDFAWPARKVAIEVEGGTWAGGRHTTGSGFVEDCRKYDTAALDGWMVLRVTGDMVASGEALDYATRALGGSAR